MALIIFSRFSYCLLVLLSENRYLEIILVKYQCWKIWFCCRTLLALVKFAYFQMFDWYTSEAKRKTAVIVKTRKAMLQVNYYRYRIHCCHLLWFASVSSYTVASHELTLSGSSRHAWNYFLQYLRCFVLIVYTYRRAALSILVQLKFACKLEFWCFERLIRRLKPIINIEKSDDISKVCELMS